MQSLEGSTINTRFTVRGKQAVPKNLMVVAIDPKSFQDLNKQFPFPRKVDGKAISTISAQHPAAIAVDVQLSEPSSLGQNDDIALLSAVNDAHGKAIFSDTEPTATGNVAFLGSGKGTALLKSVGARPAEGSFPFDPGGVIRQMQYQISNLKTLAIVTAEVATHKHVTPFTEQQVHRLRRAAGTIPYISFSQAYWGTYSGTKTGKKLPKQLLHQQDRRDRRHGDQPQRHPRELHRQRDARARDPGQRDQHGAPQLPAQRRARLAQRAC